MIVRWSKILSYILVLSICPFCDGGKIGVFMNTISSSQVVFNLRIAEILANSGHEVVIIRPVYNPETLKIRLKHEKIREVEYPALGNQEYWTNVSSYEDEMVFKNLSPLAPEFKHFGELFNKMLLHACENLIIDNSKLDLIRNENIEIAFTNHYDDCLIGAIHLLGIKKWVWVTSTPILEHQASYSGLISPPSVVPLFVLPFTNQMTYKQRAQNLVMQVLVKLFSGFHVDNVSKLFREKFGNEFPTIKELYRTASLHMINSEELFEYPRPVNHKIVFIGGLGMDSPKQLTGEFAKFVSKTQKPIVLVSFGSVAKASKMPVHWIDSFLGLFRTNRHLSFIWKYEGDSSKLDLPENVFASKWIPQTDLLGHDKTAAFISHGGYNSINECARAGKPMVLVALFVDQPRNAKLVEHRGLGLSLSKDNLTADSLSEAVNMVISDPKFHIKAKQMSEMLRDKPVKPEELLVRWTNFLLKHDPDLNMPQMTWFQFYCLDILLPPMFLLLWLIPKILKFLWRQYYWSCCEMAYKEKVKLQ